MLNRRRWIIGIILFIAAGLAVFTFANPGNALTPEEQYQQQVDDATTAVEKAEDTILQTDVDTARDLVDSLEAGSEKTDLTARLDAVQAIIDARSAVETAEDSGLATDISAARLLVNELPEGDEKTDLIDRLNAIDTAAPVVSVVGANPITVAANSTYTDLGATALDAVDGVLTANIVRTGVVNTAVVGTYTITYTVVDNAGNTGSATRTVNVTDQSAPVITMYGNTPITIAAGSVYLDLGATALDNINGDLTAAIVTTGTVNTAVVGTYAITYTVTDTAGNFASLVRTVNVTDQTKPVITVVGTNPITIAADSVYTDSGATALDNIDGNLTTKIVTTGSVDTSMVGTYIITYSVIDIAGNTATNTRTVNVTDQTAPTISINGDNTLYVNVCGFMRKCTYNDLGAMATDNIDETVVVDTTSNDVDLYTIGSYTVNYSATDAAGNVATATRNVVVRPLVSFTPNSDNDYERNQSSLLYVYPGFSKGYMIDINSLKLVWTKSASRPSAEEFTTGPRINVYRNTVLGNIIDSPRGLSGTYYLHILVKDTDGNETYALSGSFNLDNTLASVAFGTNGNETYAKNNSTTVSVTDTLSGVRNSSLKYQWTTSTSAPTEKSFNKSFSNNGTITTPTGVTGTYYLWILAKDNADNTTIVKSNAFNLDNTAPVITVLGDNPDYVEVYSRYNDEGATALDGIDGNRIVNTSGRVNTWTLGTYTITYTSSDKTGNVATATRTVIVRDTAKPTVYFTDEGSNEYRKNHDSRVFVTDNYNVNESSLKYVWTTSSTQPSDSEFVSSFENGHDIDSTNGLNGKYYLWVMAKDTSGNVRYARTEHTFALDNTAPVITLEGSNPMSIIRYSRYNEPGATARDAISGNEHVDIRGHVNTNTLGTYYVTYTAHDNAGNEATVRRTVNVIIPDTTKPVITMNGISPMTIAHGSEYSDAGATALDDRDGTVAVNTTGTVNANLVGTYTITYSATDAANNTATETRTVNVTDQTAPIITVNPLTMNLNSGDTFSDEGVTAYDAVDGNLTSSIVKSGTVNTNTAGVYTITYTVKDAANNSTTASRTVTVVDKTLPVTTIDIRFEEDEILDRAIVIVRDAGGSGLNMSKLRYLLVRDNDFRTPSVSDMQGSNSHSFMIDENGYRVLYESDLDNYMTNNVDYRLCIYAEDNAGNYKIECSSSNKDFEED